MERANAVRGLLVCDGVAEMEADVADEVSSDAPVYETPVSVAPIEAVVLPTTDDGLESLARQCLQRGEVRTRHRRAGLFVDLDGEIGREVLRPRHTVVVDDDVVLSIFSMASPPLAAPPPLVNVASASSRPTAAKSPSSTSSA
jgi:hypothetical protein